MTIRTITRSFVALIVIAPVASAQSKVPPRPAPAPAVSFAFPRIQSHDLTNGLRLFVVEDHSVAVVAVRAVLNVDETFDPAGKEGLYQVMLGALREGTTSHTPEQLADVSAKAGTPVSPTAFTTTPASLGPSLALMGEMLMQPAFPQPGVDRRKASQAASFRGVNLRPATPARNVFYSLLDGRDDPFVRNAFGTEAAVETISRDDIVRFYDEHVGPNTTTVVVVGDVTDANALAMTNDVFGAWKKSASKPSPARNVAPTPKPTTIHLIDVPGAAAAYLYIGNSGPARNAPDAFALEMAGTIASNRFLDALREKRALMYSGALGVQWHPAPRQSEFFGSTNVAPLKVDSAMIEWVSMLRDLRGTKPPTADELAKAKSSRVGQLLTKTDGPDSTANRIVEATRDHLRPDFLGAYAVGVTKVTLQDVQAAAKKYIDVDHLVIVVGGDKKMLEPALHATNLAPVVLIDANGKSLAPSVP